MLALSGTFGNDRLAVPWSNARRCSRSGAELNANMWRLQRANTRFHSTDVLQISERERPRLALLIVGDARAFAVLYVCSGLRWAEK